MTATTTATRSPTRDRTAVPSRRDRPVRVALLTPYTGGNLGDAAIQESMIDAIKGRYPDAEVCMISLSPELTSLLHGIASFPIGKDSFGPGPWYTHHPHTGPSGAAEQSAEGRSRLKAVLSRWPTLAAALRRARQMVGSSAITQVVREAGHIARAYRAMRGVSVLVVSGGGQIDDYWGSWRHPYALLKWGLIARAVRARYVFLSVGVCSLRSRVSVFLIRNALRLASYRSYRDRTSLNLLHDWSFTHNDPVCPDLAFGSRRVSRRGALDVKRRLIVGVSPIAYLSSHGWPKTNPAAYRRYVAALAGFVSMLRREGHTVVLFTTDPVDRPAVTDVVQALPTEDGSLERQSLLLPTTDTLDQLRAQLGKLDLVVASRLHGVLLSHVAALPVLAISYDRKVKTHMTDVSMSEYCLDFEGFEGATLQSAFQALRANSREISHALQKTAQNNARSLDRQLETVFGTIV